LSRCLAQLASKLDQIGNRLYSTSRPQGWTQQQLAELEASLEVPGLSEDQSGWERQRLAQERARKAQLAELERAMRAIDPVQAQETAPNDFNDYGQKAALFRNLSRRPGAD
jgi:hypothetical protein